LLKSSQKLLGPLVECKVAALNLSPLDTYKYPGEVEWQIDQNSKEDFINLAKTINNEVRITGVIIQHEYGIFGGKDGEILLTFMKKCKKPMILTLHTVLPSPSPKMKNVSESIIKYASTVVVLTNSSKKIIEEMFPGSHGKVFMIPHGIHQVSFSASKDFKVKLKLKDHTILSTFGLLSRGKGIEHVIQALPQVIKKCPEVLYLILGETHPVVRRAEGEEYRIKLAKLITKLGLTEHVIFYDQYFSLSDLFEFLKATDIYISTSINPNQSVSGTLSYALGTGRAVISTDFAYAKEIVTPELGRLVPIENSPALTKAILELLNDKKGLLEMNENAYKKTRPMLWSNVVEQYLNLLERMIVPAVNLDHLKQMTDDFGLIQFATLNIPNTDFGYTLDDNARALIACGWLSKQTKLSEIEILIKTYLNFIEKCQSSDGSFVNYIGYKAKSPTDQNNDEDIEDSQMRALWALSETFSNSALPSQIRVQAKKIFLLYLKSQMKLSHLRSKAFAIKAFALALPNLPDNQTELTKSIKLYAESLQLALTQNSFKSWRWFEKDLNYNNAILSEGLIIAGNILKNNEYTKSGLLSLEFLVSKTFSKTYMPIGHINWYKNNSKRSEYDQQPEDPASMILALTCAFYKTGDVKYKKLANICFSWFLGNNSLKKPLYDYKNGGVYDGLHPDRVNLNQGAESLVSYLMASSMITKLN
jgi:glycosyltransferase involved in cell wall biosynthesis